MKLVLLGQLRCCESADPRIALSVSSATFDLVSVLLKLCSFVTCSPCYNASALGPAGFILFICLAIYSFTQQIGIECCFPTRLVPEAVAVTKTDARGPCAQGTDSSDGEQTFIHSATEVLVLRLLFLATAVPRS